ncbi:MAG: nucleotide sugar dehydrogenase [Deltaproteobacteria bacterium]
MSAICVVGLGYIGLPTATLLAYAGHRVTGIDIDINRISELKSGSTPIEEPRLDTLLQSTAASGNLVFGTQPEPADAFFIAVPTPCNANQTCDLTDVVAAVESIVPCLSSGNLVVIESTIPPGTCINVIKPLLEKSGAIIGHDLYLAHCPERVLPGNILYELVNNNRIIGGFTSECSKIAAGYYQDFVNGRLLITDCTTAEMVKLMENTFRDLNIALANETVLICHQLGLNVLEIIKLANQHPRVNILEPGPGVGGHCLAVDPYFIIEKAPSTARLISMARQINTEMPSYIVKLVMSLLNGIHTPRIAALGITYKGNVADCRESPALDVIDLLQLSGYHVAVFDPYVEPFSQDLEAAVRDADLILILSGHDNFRYLDYRTLALTMRTPMIFDTRGLLDPTDFVDSPISFYNLGNIMTHMRP